MGYAGICGKSHVDDKSFMFFQWKPFLSGVFSGVFFGILGLLFGFFSSGFFSPFSRPGVDVDYEASSVVFFALGLCFGSVFGSFLSSGGIRKGNFSLFLAFLFALFLSVSIISLWYFPIVSSQEMGTISGMATIFLGWISGPIFYGLSSPKKSRSRSSP